MGNFWRMAWRSIGLALLLQITHSVPVAAQEPVTGPVDLRRAFVSPIDGREQPYRLYLPSAYDGKTAVPLLVALHGTGGNQDKYFDHPDYQGGIYLREAERRGLAILCPLGNDHLNRPTEWRGTGELHVLAALADVQQQFRIDSERIVCTGQSMGGTGTTYLCSRYPDLFAAGIPLASTYSHVSLMTNLRQVPFFFVHGASDWPIYAQTGPIPLNAELERLGYRSSLWMIPDVGHNTMAVSTERVLDWALEQRREAHPRHITHRAYFPPHGRAWWLEIRELDRIGWLAEVDARVTNDNSFQIQWKNTKRLTLRPDPALVDLSQPLRLTVGEQSLPAIFCNADQQIELLQTAAGIQVDVQPRVIASRLEPRNFPIAEVVDRLDWSGDSEATLGNWLTDAMRDMTQADIAIATRGHYRNGNFLRGADLPDTGTLHFIELINWLRPSDAALATFELTGADLLEILEANILNQPDGLRFLVHVSGCRYSCDRSRPEGQRVVDSDIDPAGTYRIVANSSAITRTDTLHLGSRFGKLNHRVEEPNMLSMVWYYAHKNGGRIAAQPTGRVTFIAP